ncbi:MAG: hypothetical protein KBD01_16120 [Acidobacteria bacterium]|nr:hypothetical protein [Acidobacteriota bacterium]
MIHVSVRAAEGRLLFRDWTEAGELWDRLTGALQFRGLSLMPSHVHGGLPSPQPGRLAAALNGYAQWRNRRRGESGPVWEHRSRPTSVRGPRHEERTLRYIALNPCRDRLVDDPLAWPFSSYRDMLGLAAFPVCRPVDDPERLHAYVSADSTVSLVGTKLPLERTDRPPTLGEVRAAVSALTRTTDAGLLRRGRGRSLLLRSSRALTRATQDEIAAATGVHPATVARASAEADRLVRLVQRVAGDPRFALLRDGDLRADPAWRMYSHLT